MIGIFPDILSVRRAEWYTDFTDAEAGRMTPVKYWLCRDKSKMEQKHNAYE